MRTSSWAHSACLVAGAAAWLTLTSGCSTPSQEPGPVRAPAPRHAGGHGGTAPVAPSDGEWTMPAGDYASTRYSTLDEITTGNVSRLKVAWTFSTGVTRGHEAAPLVVGQTMFIVTPYPNVAYALDLSRPGSPVKWRYEPKPSSAAQGVACCDVVNRGMVFDGGRVFFNTLDNQTVALDAESGRLLWQVRLGDINRGETITMAPLVVRDKVLVGNSGGEFGVRGWLTALDVRTGQVAWRAYSTGPDKDILIGPRFKPFYEADRAPDLGVATWPPDMWKIGGGTVWGWISYDPQLNLIYYGTANPGPWNAEQRPGDNKWTCAIFARDPDTGEAVWAYQLNPHDLFDHDEINESILLDLPIGGTVRKVLVHPARNGHMYVIDRETGEVLTAKAFSFVNSSRGVDLRTGKLIPVEEKKPTTGRVVRQVCPAEPGAKDWQPAAFSPRTGLLYVPHQNLCQDIEGTEANYISGTPFVGANVRMYGGPGGNRGVVTAWDPVAAAPAWTIKEDLPVWSGALVTAGDVMFYGTLDGTFKAVDAKSGKLLWTFATGSGIVGQPTTYKGPDGRQYVAILSGVGGWPGSIITLQLDTRDSTAANGLANAVKDLPGRTKPGGTLYVFSLQ